MSYVFKEVTNQLTNGNSCIRDYGVLRYGDKVYFTTIAGGYCYLVEVDKQGNARSLQLFANDYDPAYGEDDYHGTPAIEWIEEGKKILAVGGGHGTYTPMKWAVVDIINWSIVASGDFGSTPLTYPVLVKTSDGKISLFVTDASSGTRYIYWYEFDPSTNTWSSGIQVTSAESKIIHHLGWNIDNGYYLIGIPHPGSYSPHVIIQFDPVNKKFYDHKGNELTLPFDHSSLPANARGFAYIINNYIYTILYDDTNKILYIKKYDLDYNEVGSIELCSQANGVNTAYMGSSARLLYWKDQDKLLVGYRSNSNKFTIAEIDMDNMSLTTLYESNSTDIPLYPHEDNHMEGVFVWYNLIDTSGERDWNNETSDDHITYIVFIDPEQPPEQPSFRITSYPTSISGTPSETKTISITVQNVGDADGECILRIKDHNGNVVAEDTKTISAGGSATYSLSIAFPSETGTYTWTIEAYNVSIDRVDDTVTFTVEVEELRPEFKITNYPSTVSGSPSSSKTVNITVENQGNVEGAVELRIKDHNGSVVASQQQSIPAGQSYTFSLQITLPSDIGSYTWTIEAYNVSTDAIDDSKSFTVSVEESPVSMPDMLSLVRLCFIVETLKGLRRLREGEQAPEPDYTKCINIYVVSILKQRLSQTT